MTLSFTGEPPFVGHMLPSRGLHAGFPRYTTLKHIQHSRSTSLSNVIMPLKQHNTTLRTLVHLQDDQVTFSIDEHVC